MQKCPSHDSPLLFSRQKCQVLCFPGHPWWLHSPSCLQVSWQETAALPTGERMDSEAKKHLFLPIHPLLPTDPPPLLLSPKPGDLCCVVSFEFSPSPLQTMGKKKCTTKGSRMLQLRPRAKQVNIKKEDAQHCRGHDIKRRINRELLQMISSSVNMGIAVVSTCPRLT